MKHFIYTQQVSLKTLLEDESKYEIPKFQREYAWCDEHVEIFWKDLIEHFKSDDKTPYFFGTVVLIEDDPEKEEYRIVDGQQRLSTSIMLLAAIRDTLFEYGREIDANNINSFIEIDEFDQNDYRYRLKMSRNNQEFFLSYIIPIKKASDKIRKDSRDVSKRNKGLIDAYKILYKNICDELGGIPDPENKIRFLVSLANHFTKYFVVVRNIIDTPARAYRIFDSINNRGVELNESDLVKNYLLETIDFSDGDIDLWYDKWLEILQKLDFANVKEADFLRHFLMAHYEPTGPKEVFDKVVTRITTLEQVENFIDSLYSDAKVYRKLKSPDPSDWFGDKKIVDNLNSFGDLNAKVIFPVLLKGFDLFGSDKKVFSNLVETLLIFFFRSRTICKTSATALESLMNKICKEMRDNPAITVVKILQILKDSKEYRTDDEFKFNFALFDANTKNAFYILVNLNAELHGGRNEMTLSVERDRVSIEHIMPKVIKGTDWEKSLKETLGSDNPAELVDYHKNNLWKIGNLTLLSRTKNSRVHNIPFLEKLEKVYLKDDAKITQNLHQWHEWNGENIQNRQKILSTTALKIWSL
ncbi:MAG: DUF262 domain-containing HNH endonuclease family protein [Nitrosopumilus sp.]|uniref:DUF262 domain-containing protein n=1 Tax=Nitrosopumilus sp. TaxID=2024843 RepID=UPI00242EB57C|nr:DUF262 domain-containing protein [Nitrosopumilus sp.]MCV0366389.1 DUF262 domain-containing HNH endonuclease family protein [Nitrosopumilus sp.]